MFYGRIGVLELVPLLFFGVFLAIPVWLTIRSIRSDSQILSISSKILIFLALAWCWLTTTLYGHALTPEAIGMFTGAIFWPAAIALAIKFFKKAKGDWNGFARWFYWSALVAASITTRIKG
jgi:hypothetical protein